MGLTGRRQSAAVTPAQRLILFGQDMLEKEGHLKDLSVLLPVAIHTPLSSMICTAHHIIVYMFR